MGSYSHFSWNAIIGQPGWLDITSVVAAIVKLATKDANTSPNKTKVNFFHFNIKNNNTNNS